ncbi:MAG TPA: hypothetical protein VFO93_03895 [Hymenobacter sp.]|nr:hypothetical protein [Hymenobacter sp.]
MKSKKESVKKKLPEGFTIKPGLDEQYANQPLFQDKVDRVNYILKTVGLPDFKLLVE